MIHLPSKPATLDIEYRPLLSDIKTTIREERTKAIRQLNRSLITVYWEIGRHIIESRYSLEFLPEAGSGLKTAELPTPP